MAPAMATRRLREELIKLKTSPPPGVIAEPDESNILKWFFAIRGPADTPYEGGIYIGKLIFPSEYPMKAPSIYVLTPSGRFRINTKICMSMSDFHPESWNPMWSVATIIQGVQSFMASDELTTGGIKASAADREKFARSSSGYNGKNYPNLFDGDIEAALETAHQACQQSQKETAGSSSNSSGGDHHQKPASRRRNRRTAKITESADPEESEAGAEKGTNGENAGGNDQKTSSRRSRRLAKKTSSIEEENLDDGIGAINITGDDHEDGMDEDRLADEPDRNSISSPSNGV
eukprot:CAMPEP_0197178494 /NCGR_PEP_ID=MMETSP1423-20130617/3755_1 /TAXON_ID=476441 /ORGANISM="Pseudo-nitzschia heimii, Strain UNC1101" /LENGTH=289 /DNA_ID=CAMNT_0042628247 /DNA_START=106 /DNA_END=972 /DNA_ORIENTATION=+